MEYRRKCTVCGNIYCYTDSDIKNNQQNQLAASLSAVGAVASILGGGTVLHTHALNTQTNRYEDKVVDFLQCPKCHSRSTIEITEEEWEDLQNQTARTAGNTGNINFNATPETLLKRAFLFLEDSDWASALSYCDAVLDVEPENPNAYLGKFLADLKLQRKEDLVTYTQPIEDNKNYQKCIRFADSALVSELNSYIQQGKERAELKHMEETYQMGVSSLNKATSVSDYRTAMGYFNQVPSFKDAKEQAEICRGKIDKLLDVEEEKKKAEQAAARNKARIIKIGVIAIITIITLCGIFFFVTRNQKINAVSSQLNGLTLSFSCTREYNGLTHNRSGEITFGSDMNCKESITVYYKGKDLPEGTPTKGNPATSEKEGEYKISYSGGNTIVEDLLGYKYILGFNESGAPVSLTDAPSN